MRNNKQAKGKGEAQAPERFRSNGVLYLLGGYAGLKAKKGAKREGGVIS